MSVRSALEDLDLSAVLAAFLEQSEKHGHTADSDAELALTYFRNELIARAQAMDVVLPGDRQNLEVGYRRAAAIAAFSLAVMRRIRREQRDVAPCNTPPACPHPTDARVRRSSDFIIECRRCGAVLGR